MAYTALERLNRDEVGARAPEAVAILPTAAIEQHGPHNPIGLDTMLLHGGGARGGGGGGRA